MIFSHNFTKTSLSDIILADKIMKLLPTSRAKQRALVYRASSTMEFLIVFGNN